MASRHEVPFLYPKSQHRRRLAPGPFSRHQPYKPFLRDEFRQRCVYCRRPDSVHPHDHKSFVVEHYRPKSLFPQSSCDYGNLFYACKSCNDFKRDYWPRSESEPVLPNPCDHVMLNHLRFDDGQVRAQSHHGEFTVELLQLDQEAVVQWRRLHVAQINQAAGQLKRLLKAERLMKLRNTDDVADAQLLAELRSLDERIRSTQLLLRQLTGTTAADLTLGPEAR